MEANGRGHSQLWIPHEIEALQRWLDDLSDPGAEEGLSQTLEKIWKKTCGE